MSADRHFHAPGTYSTDHLTSEITSDITDMRAAGDTAGVDEYLDELNDVQNGTWTPKHA